ncbi:hypothetical protein HK096_008771 [Nowakowskiella sp. JEL0078]|nr:hypothetical protein HK096_008771 [Nowakowskiella sp. JEL0078]
MPNYGNPTKIIKQILSESSLTGYETYIRSEKEDNDDWMNVSLSDIDALIQNRVGEDAATADDLMEDDEIDSDDEGFIDEDLIDEEGHNEINPDSLNPVEKLELKNVHKMVESFGNFLNSESGVDGVVLVTDLKDDLSDSEDHELIEESNKYPRIFDSDKFFDILMSTVGIDPSEINNKESYESPELFNSDDESTQDSIEDLMESMDRELASTTLGQDFEKILNSKSEVDVDENFSIEKVDVDLNLVKNLLESFSSQHGLPGPASNLFGSLNIRVPKLNSNEKEQ